MGEFVLEGSSAQVDLSRLVPSRIDGMEVGQCRYGLLLNEEAGILDDLVVYRQGERSYMLVANAAPSERDREWIRSHVSPATTVTDRSDQTGKIDVQGPRSFDVLREITDVPLESLQYYRCGHGRIWEFEALISRTGYTGELGYEIYVGTEAVGEVWDRLVEHPLVEPAGLGARDTLRLEMGFPLYGQDIDERRTPLEAGLGRHVDMSKDFIGKQALIKRQKEGLGERLVGLALQGRQAARHGFGIWEQERMVGAVSSGSFAPSLGRAVALGYVASSHASSGTGVAIRAQARVLQAQVAEVPFYRGGTARADPTDR
jgi:aminomethyltransferase